MPSVVVRSAIILSNSPTKGFGKGEFLPPGLCTRCDVTEESYTHSMHEATIGGQDLREIIALEPERKVTFCQATDPREGAIIAAFHQ